MTGRLHHVALAVDDLESALPFYALLGFHEATRAELHDATVLVLLAGAQGHIELIWTPETLRIPPLALAQDLRRTGARHLGLISADLDADIGKLAAAGHRAATPTAMSPYGLRYAFFNDPCGNWVELLGP